MTRNPSYIRTDKAIIQAFIDLLKEKILAVYDDLHAIPEVGWEEVKTSA